MKKLTRIILAFALMLAISTSAVKAVVDTVTISHLPEYTRSDNFYLSYSALSDSTNVQFCYKKDGGTYSAFGPVFTNASGQQQVTGSQISEQAKYFFKVVLNGSGCTGGTQDETSITYDISGPSPVQNYWKEMVAPGHYKLHWKNPGDDDFSRVFIYRSESTDFDANGSTKVAEVGGSKDADATWDNPGLDGSKTYYYALIAVDKAGNASSVVADPEVGAVVDTGTTTSGTTEETVTSLPTQEGTSGSVLGGEDESSASDSSDDESINNVEDLLNSLKAQEGREVSSSTFGKILRIVLTLVIAYFLYRLFFRRKRNQ